MPTPRQRLEPEQIAKIIEKFFDVSDQPLHWDVDEDGVFLGVMFLGMIPDFQRKLSEL